MTFLIRIPYNNGIILISDKQTTWSNPGKDEKEEITAKEKNSKCLLMKDKKIAICGAGITRLNKQILTAFTNIIFVNMNSGGRGALYPSFPRYTQLFHIPR